MASTHVHRESHDWKIETSDDVRELATCKVCGTRRRVDGDTAYRLPGGDWIIRKTKPGCTTLAPARVS